MEIEMQKGLNACKLIMALVLCSASIQAQNLTGKYCIENSSMCLNFTKDGYFEYTGHCDELTEDYGIGQYTTNNDKLVLNFNLSEKTHNSFHTLFKTKTDNDSVDVAIKALEASNKNDVSFAIVKVNGETKKCDFKGTTNFKIKRSFVPIEIEVFTTRHKAYTLNIVPDQDQKIEAFLSIAKCYIQDQKWKFTILEQTNKSIILKKSSNLKDKRYLHDKWIKTNENL